ncbi:carbohydrate ABC transporter permease [Arthrobacter monumenti]
MATRADIPRTSTTASTGLDDSGPLTPSDGVEPPHRPARPSHPVSGGKRRRRMLGKVIIGAALALATLMFIYPLVWLLSASFKPRSQVFDNKLIPETFTLDNYVRVWQEAPLALWIGNTAIVTVLGAVAVTISSALVAWGFARFRFRGRNVLFGVVLATMMLPGAVTMIPRFLIWDSLGMVGTLTPLWAANLFGSAFYIFLLRQFFLTLPNEVFEAATIDGANHWQQFWKIGVPLCKPAMIVTLIFEFQAAWTDLMGPLIYLRDSSTFTVPRGLKALVDQFGVAGEFAWEIPITASVITTIPMIILFFVAQKHFIKGVATTGVKG